MEINIVSQAVVNASDRVNELTRTYRNTKTPEELLQISRGILVDELNKLGIYPDDAYHLLHIHSVEEETDEYIEPLAFLEYCIS
jgi:hypothetical protein